MRAKEFVSETKAGKISKRYKKAAAGVNTYYDKQRFNTDYTEYRLGMAVACSNGTDPLDIDGQSWFGKMKTSQPYTDIEQKMLNQAYKIVGAGYDDLNKGKLKSQELDDTNKQSPIAKNPWNKKSKKVAEAASVGATSTAAIPATPNPRISPGKARGKTSYTGSPGKSGTKAPPQPKVKQPKTAAGTAKNALDMTGTSIFGAPLRRGK